MRPKEFPWPLSEVILATKRTGLTRIALNMFFLGEEKLARRSEWRGGCKEAERLLLEQKERDCSEQYCFGDLFVGGERRDF